MSERITQQDKILARLREGPATTLDLILSCGTVSPTKRISELRRDGHEITSSEQWKGRTRVVTYRLSETMQQQVATAP